MENNGKMEACCLGITLNEYQRRAMSTCTESSHNFAYMLNGLGGEYGELAGKVAKGIRKGLLEIKDNRLILTTDIDKADDTDELYVGIIAELGDCLWFIAGLCDVLGIHLNDLGWQNLDKLADRAQRGVIVGDGDNR